MQTKTYQRLFPVLLLCALAAPQNSRAQIDKVYHPYVYQTETEFEFRTIYQNDRDQTRDGTAVSRLGFGHAFTDRFALEGYMIGERQPEGGMQVQAYEVEGQIQLTEQGEYWADWGLLLELEKERRLDNWEIAAKILFEKETGNWISAVNLGLAHNFDSDSEENSQTSLAAQLKYRLSLHLEPALELYADEDIVGIGPVIMGTQRIGRNKLNWEFGLIAGLNNDTADNTLRFLIDYEF